MKTEDILLLGSPLSHYDSSSINYPSSKHTMSSTENENEWS